MRAYGFRHGVGYCGPHDAQGCACERSKRLRRSERQRGKRLCQDTGPDQDTEDCGCSCCTLGPSGGYGSDGGSVDYPVQGAGWQFIPDPEPDARER